MRFPRRKQPQTPARQVRDEWLQWLELGGARPATVKGYRWTTERLLDRYPELTFGEFTDEHILGIIEESNPASRQARRSAFANWFGWGYRAKRIKHNPMHHVPTYKQPDQQPVDVFSEAECAVLCALPEPDGTLMALLLGSGLRKAEASNLSVRGAVGQAENESTTTSAQAGGEVLAQANPGPPSSAASGDGWTGTLYPSLRCDYCGDEVIGSDAPSLDSAKEAHRESCPPTSYYFGGGTRRHEASHLTDNWVTMWCGIGGRTSGPAVKVRSSRVEPNCRACARAKARNLANA